MVSATSTAASRSARRAASRSSKAPCASVRATFTRLPVAGAVLLGQCGHRLPGQGQGRAVTQMIGLRPGQCVEIGGSRESGTSRIDGGGQRGLRQQIGRWLTHATGLSFWRGNSWHGCGASARADRGRACS